MRGRVILPAGRTFRRVGPAQIVMPRNLPPGMQKASARVRYRLATCAEYEHDPCGRLHKLPAWERPTYTITYRDGSEHGHHDVVTEDEFINRLGEGVEALQAAVILEQEG